MAELSNELFERQKVALVGFDVVFAEPDDSSGLKQLRRMAQAELKDQPGFIERLGQLQGALDYDSAFAQSLRQRPVVLGYYFTSDRDGRTSGVLPEPVMQKESLHGRPIRMTSWNGFGSNIQQLAAVAPISGFFNPIVEADGVVRSIPLLAEYGDLYYESLALAMFRVLAGMPSVERPFRRNASSRAATRASTAFD
jgi:adenylate cyclase